MQSLMAEETALEHVCSCIAQQNTRILVGGQVNSGKSTFARKVVNKIVESGKTVAWLDCDVGQPEFTPPSVVSLHILNQPIEGTPFDHIRKPKMQYFVGSVTPKTEIEYYLACIFALFNDYQEILNNRQNEDPIPLIINTNGWIKGNGGRILSTLIATIEPNIVVQLLTENFISANRNLVNYESLVPNSKIITLRSFSPATNSMNSNVSKYQLGDSVAVPAKKMRDLMLMKYFQCDKIPLSHRSPFRIHWKYIRIRFLHDEISCSYSMLALNGMVVGLCCDPAKYQLVGEKVDIHQEYPEFLLSTPLCECVGLGIIRAIDPVKHLFYIVTPLSLKALSRVNTIMKGNIELPTISLLEGGVTNVPYVCSNTLTISDDSGAIPMDKKRATVPRLRPE